MIYYVLRLRDAPADVVYAERCQNSGVIMRFYFDLTDGHSVIRDELGVDARSLDDAYRQSGTAIREMLDTEDLDRDGVGWTIMIRDFKGIVRRTIEVGSPLDEPGH